MKGFSLLLLAFVCIMTTHAQVSNNRYGKIVVEFTKEKKSSKANIKTEVKSFVGLDSVWVQSIEKKFNQSIRITKKAKKGLYVVSVKFITSKDGIISDITCENDPGFGLCEEVLREVKKKSKWTSGSIMVKPLRTSTTVQK